jgi:hypothetical protein
MKVGELKSGTMYKIRSDRKTMVQVRNGYLDIHLFSAGMTASSWATVSIRPFDLVFYIGKNDRGWREVVYRGQHLKAHGNIWQHIRPLDDDIS